jgi:hypothetical protein
MTVLLGILTACSFVAAPTDCIPARPERLTDIPLLLTYYDPWSNPEMPDEDNISCDNDCNSLSLVPMSNGLYGVAAACPAELVGYIETAVIHHPDIGTRYCLDRGGGVVIEYGLFGGRWQYVIRIDLLELESNPHPLNYHLLSGWDYEWVSTAGVLEGLE